MRHPAPPVDTAQVVVVGAGFAGLAAVMALRAAGVEDVVVIERADAIGGTWRENTYPGVACDIPSHLYGFAGHPEPGFSHVFGRGGQIRAYLEKVAAREGIRPLLSTPMRAARWDDQAGCWQITTGGAHPGRIRARALVLACGRLTEPRIPAIPGLESFPGAMFHTARWDHATAVDGRRVAVVGTGASAVQLVPELAGSAQVTLFQRTPAWIMPRGDRAYTADEQAGFAADPARLTRLREQLYTEGEARFPSRAGDPDASARARDLALAHLHAQVRDRHLREALTPHYAFGCKRVLLSDRFYPALDSGAVDLVPAALARVEGDTLISTDGHRRRADVLVLATGFHSTQQPYAPLVHGRHGTLAEHWGQGMTAFASTVVAGFPNMFVLDGPNASLGHNSSVLMMEAQAEYTARTLAHAEGVLCVDPAAERAWTERIDRAAASTPWVSGCENWYVDGRSGRLTLLWPGTVGAFRDLLATADGSEFLPAAERSTR